jgi:hypothetical protein
LVATRKIPSKPAAMTEATIVSKIDTFVVRRSIRVCPGFWATPAQMTTIAASRQSS